MADSKCQETEGSGEKTTELAEKMDADESESEMEDIYEVEKIVDVTKSKGKTLYRVRWAGYGPGWDTWEPYSNLESCKHVIDQYITERRQAQAKAQAAQASQVVPAEAERGKQEKKDFESVSVDGSDSDSVHSSASRKKKARKPNYVYVEDEDCDTLKDKFWRDLEEGKINVFGNDMYSKVKGQGRSSRPTSFSGMFRNQPLEDLPDVALERRARKRSNQESSGSSVNTGSVKADSPAGACTSTRAKRQRLGSLPKESSQESEMSVFGTDEPSRASEGGTGSLTSVEAKTSMREGRGKPQSVAKKKPHVRAESNSDLSLSGNDSASEKSGESGTSSGSKEGQRRRSDGHGHRRRRSGPKWYRQRSHEEERTPSLTCERAPIVVIRRSADGQGYTQKLVEDRSQLRQQNQHQSPNTADHSHPADSPKTHTSSNRKLTISLKKESFDGRQGKTNLASGSDEARADKSDADSEKTIVSGGSDIQISPQCKAELQSAVGSCSRSSGSSRLRSPTSSQGSSSESTLATSTRSHRHSDTGRQAAAQVISELRTTWMSLEPRLFRCHVPLHNVMSPKEARLLHWKGNQQEKVVTPATSEIAIKASTCMTGGISSCSSRPDFGVQRQVTPPSPVREQVKIEPGTVMSSSGAVSCSHEASCSSNTSMPTFPMVKCKVEPVEAPTSKPETTGAGLKCSSQVPQDSRVPSNPTQHVPPQCLSHHTSSHERNPQGSPIPDTEVDWPLLPLPSEYASLDAFAGGMLHEQASGTGLVGCKDDEIPGLGDIPPLPLRTEVLVPPTSSPDYYSQTSPRTTMATTSSPSCLNQSSVALGLCSLPTVTSVINSPMSSTSPYATTDPDLQALTDALSQTAESILSTQHQTPDVGSSGFRDLASCAPLLPPILPQQPLPARPPYPTPSPTLYSPSPMMSPYGPDHAAAMSPASTSSGTTCHLEPASPHTYMPGGVPPASTTSLSSPLHAPMESPRYAGMGTVCTGSSGGSEEPCNQFNDVDLRRGPAGLSAQLQQMSRSSGAATNTSVSTGRPTAPASIYNPYSPHQGASPYSSTSGGSPAAWSMSSPSPGTPGSAGVGISQHLSNLHGFCSNNNSINKLLADDTAFDFDLDTEAGFWDPKRSVDKKSEPMELTNVELKNAVRNNDYEMVRRALLGPRRYDLEMHDDMGVTLLMMAAARSHDDILELLVLNHANINARSKSGSTALMYAAENGHRCTVELLLIMGAHMNVQQASGETALIKAVKNGNKHIVRLLLDHGANFSSPSYLNDLTAMKVAKQRNQTDIMEMLNKHISWVTADFENQVKITLNNTAQIQCALFPMQCFTLAESDQITITFNHELQPTRPGLGMLLFIAHARITSTEARCRFYGPCAVSAAALNGFQLHPLTEEANFVMSFSPLYNGRNDLEIKTVKASTSRAKLVVCAYQAQLILPPD